MDSNYPVPVPQPVGKTKGASSEEYALGTGNSARQSLSEPGSFLPGVPLATGLPGTTDVASGSTWKGSTRPGSESDRRLHALCCQAFELKGSGYLRDACDAIVVEWHRRFLVELLKETA